MGMPKAADRFLSHTDLHAPLACISHDFVWPNTSVFATPPLYSSQADTLCVSSDSVIMELSIESRSASGRRSTISLNLKSARRGTGGCGQRGSNSLYEENNTMCAVSDDGGRWYVARRSRSAFFDKRRRYDT